MYHSFCFEFKIIKMCKIKFKGLFTNIKVKNKKYFNMHF